MATTAGHASAVRIRTGVTMHYVESGPADAPEVVVLLHGWPDSAFSFSRVTPALAAAGHRALAVDQRGFGDSSRPSTGYRVDDLAEDAAAFLDALDLPAVTLVGHSMGTFVARRVTQLHPDRVRRLVLIGTAATAANDVVREVVALVADLPDPVPEAFAREFQAGTIHHPVPQPFFERIVAESVKAPARVWREVVNDLPAYDDEARLAGIGVPTLLLGGEQDALFPPAEQAAVAAAIPRARLTLYPDTGHCPNWERPERVAADIDAFIRESSARSRNKITPST